VPLLGSLTCFLHLGGRLAHLARWVPGLVGAGTRAAVGEPGWFVPRTQGKGPWQTFVASVQSTIWVDDLPANRPLSYGRHSREVV